MKIVVIMVFWSLLTFKMGASGNMLQNICYSNYDFLFYNLKMTITLSCC